MKRSGLSAICMAFATDYQPGNAYDRFLKGLASMDRQSERNGMKRSLTLTDVRTAHKKKQPTVIQAVEGYARNVRALVDVIGVDHVCIGTDTKLTQPSPRPSGPGGPHTSGPGRGGPPPGPQHPRVGERTNQAWQDETAGFYYVVVDAMLKTGFKPDEIAKIGGDNFLRVFGEAVKK